MAAPRRAPVRLEDLLLDDDSDSESDADTYDESLDIGSVAGSLFSPDSDDEESDDDMSDAALPLRGDEAPDGSATTTAKSRREKRDRTTESPGSCQLENSI